VLFCQIGMVLYTSKLFDLLSAVLEVPVFTVAGRGSLESVCLTRSVRRLIGIYPRIFHWIVRTCISMQVFGFR
jgi:hypothetical protein